MTSRVLPVAEQKASPSAGQPAFLRKISNRSNHLKDLAL